MLASDLILFHAEYGKMNAGPIDKGFITNIICHVYLLQSDEDPLPIYEYTISL